MKAKLLDPLAVSLAGTNLIEASAGTGKTYTITTLFVRLLLELELSVDQILVVTFTRAATAELRDRVRRRLQEVLEALQGGDPGEDHTLRTLLEQRAATGQLDQDGQRLRAALRGLDDAAIFTIHGFCQRMLHENAFESGVEFDTELVTDIGPLVATCVHDFWATRLYDLAPEVVRHMRETSRKKTGVTRQTLNELAFKVIANRDLPVLPERFEPPAQLETPDDLDAHLRWIELELVDEVRETAARRKAEAGIQSYDDLLVGLRDALRRDQEGVLAGRIAERYGAALIDEFQDTDPVQYEVFRTAFHDQGRPLFLIGDPKQAIYSFRGADLFAYLSAIEDAGQRRHTLGTNFRSDAPLVTGVNTLFERIEKPFVFDEIAFSPVEAHWEVPRLSFPKPGPRTMEILFLPRDQYMSQRTKFIVKKNLGDGLSRMVATEIARFLSSGALVEGEPARPGHVAVLCRTNKEVVQIQEALRRLGVPSVLQSEASVLDTPEAEEMERIARALAEPEQMSALKAALTTPTLGTSLNAMRSLQEDVTRWNDAVSRFRSWSEIWTGQGFIQAFRRMLADEGIEARLLGFGDGERSLTNLLHLAELMQSAATAGHLGPHALLHWLHRMRTEKSVRGEVVGEAAQIRLESDEHAVKLVTVHKSKGLEYPVVYCPYLWSGQLLIGKDDRWIKFHDRADHDRLKLDIASDERAQHLEQAKIEAMAENMRLTYVALTRARHRCSVVWGGFNLAGTSPLAYALHQAEGRSGPELMRSTESKFKAIKEDAPLLAELQELVEASNGTIELRVLDPKAKTKPYRVKSPRPKKLEARALSRRPPPGWSVASFSSLTSHDTGELHPAQDGQDLDASIPPQDTVASTAAGPPDEPAPSSDSAASSSPPLGQLPVLLGTAQRGTSFGRFVHKIFEHLDFETASTEDIEALAGSQARRSRHEVGDVELIVEAIGHVLDTPLERVAPDFRLRSLPRSRRLDEMEFHLPVALKTGTAPRTGAVHKIDDGRGVEAADLARLLEARSALPEVRQYAASLATLGFPPLTGFLKGLVDLVFVHQDRWFIVDYKSNFLGPHAGDYAPHQLHESMALHHYYLQYHLYALALHRHLARHLEGYTCEEHLGGVLYLFVRGMSPGAPPESGVYFDPLSPEMMLGLDGVMSRASADGGQP